MIKYLALLLVLTACAEGSPGSNGANGPPGDSCTVQDVSNGAIITCGLESVVILDGEPSPYGIIDIIDPCGNESGFDEVLLKLHNGQLMAHYSSGSLQFLVLISPGNYVTTDGHACHFSVDSNFNVSW